MKAILLTALVVCLISTFGCALVTPFSATKDRNLALSTQQRLTCGMTITEVEQNLAASLLVYSDESDGFTHVYSLDFAKLLLKFKEGRLVQAKTMVLKTPKTFDSEPVKYFCSSK